MDLIDKQILITGGTGFIGAAIANKLIDHNCNVNIISRSNEFVWRIKEPKKCNFYEINLQNSKKLKKCINKVKPEIIFHLAAYVNPECEKEAIDKAYNVNFNGTKNLVMNLEGYKYVLLINTGTSEEYGKNKAPFKETFRESPVSVYSASKVAATYFCEFFSNVFDKPIITIRPFLIYGPKQISKSLIPSLIYSGFTKKKLFLTPCEQTRDFLYIEDVIDAYISLAKNAKKIRKMGIFNLGSGKEIPINEVVNLLKSRFQEAQYLIGAKNYRIGERMNYYASIEKIKNVIDWKPKWKIHEGIDKTIEWWKNNKEIVWRYKNIWE
ncbi:MAG: NAD-dependent epimerase/dehydratase family protein [Promethearchaeota archaeon]